ncbi:MAG: ankyrin repeat domain-containing protein [Treponema sp.]|nr:ankyrin repeat domain-containing protein [Treponema sp.]
MKKILIISLVFLCSFLFADDYKWDYVNALTRGDYPVIENIINRNINNVPASEKRLILNFALIYSRGETTLQVLSLLRRHNVIPNAFDLYTAINRDQPDTVIQYILNNGVQPNGEILLLAMEKQRLNFASQFIQAGVDVNYQYPLSRDYSDGMTALLHASRYNNMELVRLLVDRGANINARNREGNTALSIAQYNGNAQISDFLIGRGANHTGVTQNPNQQSGGIGAFMDTQVAEFQPGSYRLSRGNRDLTFTGTANYGSIAFIRDNRVYSGSYQSNNGNLIMIMDGRMFTYKVDSETSFSGNGEVWVRTSN